MPGIDPSSRASCRTDPGPTSLLIKSPALNSTPAPMKFYVVTQPSGDSFAYSGRRKIRSFPHWENPEDPPKAWRQAICPEEWASRVQSMGHTVDLYRFNPYSWHD